MFRGIQRSPQAICDIDVVSAHLATDSHATAIRFQAMVRETCESLIGMPFVGRTTDSRFAGFGETRWVCVRGFPNYLVFYSVDDEWISILRVLHGARDLDALLDDEGC